ncbi:MAG: alpha/beta hydrolase [Actinomycetota bacterium]
MRRILTILILAALSAGCSGGTSGGGSPPPETSVESPATSPSPMTQSGSPATRDFSVVINGVTIEGHCSGTEGQGPTVILTHGNGGSEDQLFAVEEHMDARTLVCAYTRPGTPSSADSPKKQPRPVSEVVTEMHAVLEAAEIPPPYFLVGTSAGGVITFMFAQAYASDVSGFVVINPMPPPCAANAQAARKFISKQLVEEKELPDCRGDNPEQIVFLENDSELKDPLPAEMPYHVLFDENCDGDTEYCDKVLQWLPDLMRRLSRVGAAGEFTWVKGAGHEIESSRPDIVLATVDDVFEKAVQR